MNMQVRKADGRPIAKRDRPNTALASFRRIARVPGFADRKKGVRSYQSHIKDDPWLPILFVVCFVLPTLVGALYFGLIASDRYVTEAQIAVRPAIGTAEKANPDSVGTNAGSPKEMLVQDILIIKAYTQSRSMLEAVEAKLPIREWFSRDDVDYFSRFDPSKSAEKALKYWNKRVSVDVEPGTGIMSFDVNAFDPEESFAIMKAVLAEAERMANELTTRPRQDAVVESSNELKRADERVATVQKSLNDLRNREGVLDAVKANETNLKLISELRLARTNLAIQLEIGQRDLGPNARHIIDIKQQIRDLDDNIARAKQQAAGQNSEQRRRLSDALTSFEAMENERKNAEKYREQVRLSYERARVLAAQKSVFLTPVVDAMRATSSTEPKRLLMISIVTAGAAVLFAVAVFTRKSLLS